MPNSPPTLLLRASIDGACAMRALAARAFLLALLLATLPAAPLRAQLFPGQIVSREYAEEVVVADLNNDGHADLVHGSGFEIHVQRRVAPALYSAEETISLAFSAPLARILVEDLNGDGLRDLAYIAVYKQNVNLLANDGGTNFVPLPPIPVPFGTTIDLRSAFIDVDGRTDLVVANGFTDSVVVLKSNFAIGFGYTASVLEFPTSGGMPANVVVVDTDDDGLLDIVTARNGIKDLQRHAGLPGGTFTPVASIVGGFFKEAYFASVVTAELSGATSPDLVWVNEDAEVVLATKDPSGPGYITGPGFPPFVTGTRHSLAVADLDSDGDDEVAVCHSSVGVYGDSGGYFLLQEGELVTNDMAPGAHMTRAAAFGDLDNDNRLDLVTANESTAGARVLLHTNSDLPSGFDYGIGMPRHFPAGDGPRDVAPGDITGDGITDAVLACGDSDTLSVVPGQASGLLGSVPASYAAGDLPVAVALGHLNGDGRLDAVSVSQPASGGATAVSVHLNNGAGGLQAPVTMQVNSGIEESGPASDVALADMDANGTLDVVVSSKGKSGADIAFAAVLLNNGAGVLGSPAFTLVSGLAVSMALGDLNGDLRPDVVTATNDAVHGVAVFLNNGSGGLLPPVSFTASTTALSTPTGVALGDINEDGKLDAVVCHSGNDSVTRLLGTGTGSFGAPVDLVTGLINPDDVVLADADADGHLDAVIANTGDHSVAVLLGNGNGTFEARRDFHASSGPVAVALGDLDGDAFPDLFAALPDDDVVLYDINLLKDRFATVSIGLAGTAGIPTLKGSGTLAPNSPVTLTLASAKPASTWSLIIGVSALNAPFKGGTLVPAPNVIISGLPTLAGSLPLSGAWPAGLTGFPIYFQGWVSDSAGPQGFAATAGLKATGG